MLHHTRTSGTSACLLLLSLVLGTPQIASAATTFLSGDGNIIGPLVGDGHAIDPGNQQFFINVLGSGTRVAVLQSTCSSSCDRFDENLTTFYNSLSGVSATTIVDSVTDAALADVDLFLSAVPDDAFTVGEILALEAFSTGGGTIFFLGDNRVVASQNGFINDALAALGVGMSIDPDTSFDTSFHTATGSQIADDPFTAGVGTFTYAAPSSITGGNTLFFGTALEPFVAYVPEPGTGLLLMTGLLGLAGYRRGRA